MNNYLTRLKTNIFLCILIFILMMISFYCVEMYNLKHEIFTCLIIDCPGGFILAFLFWPEVV